METLFLSLTINKIGKARKKTSNGREYLVAPATLIVPGVLDGSGGAGYYPLEEIARNPGSWDHMPITLGHPVVNGTPVSARRPDVIDSSCLGYVFNSKAEGKLAAEAWFDVEWTKKKAKAVYDDLVKNQPIELSTGLFLDKEKAEEGATFNQRSYDWVARNFRPDHLAVLPGGTGACSLKDGCGILVNSIQVPDLNELSHEQIRDELYKALRSRFTQDDPYCSICEVYDGYFVYYQGPNLYRLGYSAGDEGITLDDTPVAVIREFSYKPVSNESPPEVNDMATKLADKTRNEIVQFITTNCDCWKFKEAPDILNKMPDKELTNLKATVERSKDLEAVANAARKGFGLEDDASASDLAEFVANGDGRFSRKEEGKKERTDNTTSAPEKKETPTPKGKMNWNELVENADDDAREKLEYVADVVKNERKEIIENLSAHLEDGDEKKEYVTYLKGLKLKDLRIQAKHAAPLRNRKRRDLPDPDGGDDDFDDDDRPRRRRPGRTVYPGVGGPSNVPTGNKKRDLGQPMERPDLDWESISAEGMHRRN